MSNGNNQESREIKVARIAFIGAAIAAIGDGIAAYAAGLALDILINPEPAGAAVRSSSNDNLEETQAQMDYYINELISIRNTMK